MATLMTETVTEVRHWNNTFLALKPQEIWALGLKTDILR